MRNLRGVFACSAAICAVAIATPAVAQVKILDAPAKSATTGVPALTTQADI